MKELLRPIYQELCELMLNAPPSDIKIPTSERIIWENFNRILLNISEITNEDYSQYKIEPLYEEVRNENKPYLSAGIYRTNLSSLLWKLHSTYFRDEPITFLCPSTKVVCLSQSITTTALLTHLGVDLCNARDKASLQEEKQFVDEVISRASTILSYKSYLRLILDLAVDNGLDIKQVRGLFI